MADPASYLRYGDHLDTPAPGEDETIAGIIAAMTGESETVARRDGRTVRASHAKSTGLVKGSLTVLPALPSHLRQGLFAERRTFPVLMRFAQGPGEVLPDSVSTHRGVGIKVLGVEGPRLPGHDAATQDFVLATGPAFPQADAPAFLTVIESLRRGTPMPEGLKQAVSSTARVANAALNAVGADSPTLGFFGHTRRNPLADSYFSQAALRYGEHVAKVGLFPVSPELVAMLDRSLDTATDRDAFRHALVGHLRIHAVAYELRVQLCRDLESMPIEDASVAWSETDSPYLPVARIDIPAQDACSPARQAYFDEILSFQPAHALDAHRPLGSLMRARLKTYQALSAHRLARNGRTSTEPQAQGEVPD